jgi:hypothetical protein
MHLAAAEGSYQVLLLRIGTLMPKKRKMGRSFRFGSMVEMISKGMIFII